jgi:Tfp pilus assembly protein PilF
MLGPEHLHTLTSMTQLGGVLSGQGKYVEAEQMHRQTLELRKVLGLEHPDTLTSMNNLGWALSSEGKYVKAEQMHRQHSNSLTNMNNLGWALSGQGKDVEAEQIHRQTLELSKEALWKKHIGILTYLYSLACLIYSRG